MMPAPRDDLVRSAPFSLDRAAADDGLTLTGHGAVFNEWTTIDSWEGRFRERIAPGAFKRTLANNGARVRLQFDHGQHPLIGSLPIGSIRKLKEDGRGLYVEARLADNWLVQPVREAIENGSVDGMSFRFSVVADRWDNEDSDLPERTITEVRLMELGPVVWPAYEGTDVGVRALELARGLLRADDETRREVARLLTSGIEDLSTSPDEPADGTSPDEPASSGPPHGTRSDDDAPLDEHVSPPIKRAAKPEKTSEARKAEADEVRARAAAARSARSAA